MISPDAVGYKELEVRVLGKQGDDPAGRHHNRPNNIQNDAHAGLRRLRAQEAYRTTHRNEPRPDANHAIASDGATVSTVHDGVDLAQAPDPIPARSYPSDLPADLLF